MKECITKRRGQRWLLMAMPVLFLAALSARNPDGQEGDASLQAPPPASISHLRVAPELPEGAVFQGYLHTPEGRLVLYRHPTRLERTQRLVRAHTLREPRSRSSAGIPPLERMRRHIRSLLNRLRTSRPEQLFAGVFLFAFTSMAGLGWMEQHRHARRRKTRVRLPPTRRSTRSRNPHRDRPASAAQKWSDAWTPAPARLRPRQLGENIPKPNPTSPPLAGSIRAFPIENTLQILRNANQTGALIIKSETSDCVGSFKFCKGDLVGVYAGSLTGEEAAFSLLSRANGFYELRTIPISENDVLHRYDLTWLLIEAHRRMDEARTQCPTVNRE